jgi:Immunoglobulin domain/NHL repeat/Immunoglobulin I-set domain
VTVAVTLFDPRFDNLPPLKMYGHPSASRLCTNPANTTKAPGFRAPLMGACYRRFLRLLLVLIVVCTARPVRADTSYTWSTLAGKLGGPGNVDGTGSAARFSGPSGVAADASGNVFVADTLNHVIRKITSAGIVSTFAGTSGSSGSTDGTGSAARFSGPTGVAVDASGNVFVADYGNNVIRKITSVGIVSTFAGYPGIIGSADGTGTAARFKSPYGIAVDAFGNVFVADKSNHVIRKITSAGVVSTLAGTAGSSGSTNGTGSAVLFSSPSGVAIDASGNVFVADTNNHAIRKITSAGVVSSFAGSATSGSTDGTGGAAMFSYPYGVAMDASGNVFVADANNHAIRKITSAGVVSTFASTAGNIGSTDGTGSAARFNAPSGVAVDISGNVFVADKSNNVIREITSAAVVTTVAGSAGSSGSIDGTGSAAQFNSPSGVAVDASANVWVADTSNHLIRRVTSAGAVSTFAGSAGSPGSTDGTGSAARFNALSGVAADAFGNLFVADTGNHTIRKITSTGVVSTFAGTPGSSGSTDGTGSAARFKSPYGVAADASGNVFVVDTGNHTIRKITSTGVVSTFAGTPGSSGSTDGTGSAARFKSPYGVAADASGNVFVADTGNLVIRKITSTGVVSTFAGYPGSGGGVDGPGDAARFSSPSGIAVDTSGNVFVTATTSNRICKITSARYVSTIGGLPSGASGNVNGIGSAARFNSPFGVASDSSGNVFVAEKNNNVIRLGSPASVPPSITTQPGSLTVTSGSSALFSAVASGSEPLSYQWKKNGAAISSGTNALFTIASTGSLDAGNYTVVVSNAAGTVTSSGAVLTVNVPVSISSHPASVTTSSGSSATFVVTATGTAPLAYQWRKNGTNISGATSATYAIASVGAGDEASYDVIINNPVGSVTSAAATLTVNTPVSIVTQPVSINVTSGSFASFSITAAGTSPTYQWRKNGVNIAGANAASYVLTNALTTDVGAYSVVVTNMLGSVTSSTANLVVNVPVTITTQPVSISKTVGAAASFSVTASGTAPLTYQWRKDGSNIAGATSATYTIPSINAAHAASYDVIVTNVVGSIVSSGVMLNVNTPVAITTQPIDLTVATGSGATFSVVASGSAPLTYQWRKDGTNIAGATSASYTIPSAAAANAASYSVVVTNVVGSVTSNTATLTVNTPLTITSQPTGLTKNTGSTASFSVTATGTTPITYQWRKDGAAVSGATTSTYNIGSVSESHAGSYDVVLVNPAGSLTSGAAVLSIQTPPTLTTLPSSTAVIVGMPASFRVAATDTGPLVYQWRKGGVPVVGATSPIYAIAAAQTSDAGTYDCVVSGAKGSVTTTPVVLTVNKPTGPVITGQPVGAGLPIGSPYTLKVTVAASAGIVTYQWFKDNVLIPGATGSTHTIASLSANSWGGYTVAVTNTVGRVISATAMVTIVGPPVIYSDPPSLVVPFGSPGTVSAKVLCVSSFAYQWKRNGVLIGSPITVAGGSVPITMTYTISNATTDSEGLYSVSAFNTQGAVESHPAVVQLDIAFFSTRLVRAGRTFDLRKVVNNGVVSLEPKVPSNDILQALIRTSGPASIWWSWGPMSVGTFQPILGATGASLDFAAFGLNKKPGQFMLTVKVGALPAKSIKFLVTSWGPAITTTTLPTGGLTIVTQPQPLTLNADGAANFGVFVSGSPSVYSWYKINPSGVRTLVSTGTGPFLSLSPVQISDAARYFVVCADLLGSTIESAAVQLTVLPKGD